MGSSLRTFSLEVVGIPVSFAEVGEAPTTDWTLSLGNTDGLFFLLLVTYLSPPPLPSKNKNQCSIDTETESLIRVPLPPL